MLRLRRTPPAPLVHAVSSQSLGPPWARCSCVQGPHQSISFSHPSPSRPPAEPARHAARGGAVHDGGRGGAGAHDEAVRRSGECGTGRGMQGHTNTQQRQCGAREDAVRGRGGWRVSYGKQVTSGHATHWNAGLMMRECGDLEGGFGGPCAGLAGGAEAGASQRAESRREPAGVRRGWVGWRGAVGGALQQWYRTQASPSL